MRKFKVSLCFGQAYDIAALIYKGPYGANTNVLLQIDDGDVQRLINWLREKDQHFPIHGHWHQVASSPSASA